MKDLVISIDGGGVRGVIPLQLLKLLQPYIKDRIFAISGTSSGAIIAASLALGHNIHETEQYFIQVARDVFRPKAFSKIRSIFGPKYDINKLHGHLVKRFSDIPLGDIPVPLIIPTFNINYWKAKIFHNIPGQDFDEHVPLANVLTQTCAAPTYFADFQGNIDGGVILNNPTLAAYAAIQDPRNNLKPDGPLKYLSIGTGYVRRAISKDTKSWGLKEWSTRIIPLMMDGNNRTTDFIMKQFHNVTSRINYMRVEGPVFIRDLYDLDDIQHIETLTSFGKNHADFQFSRVINWILRA